MTTTLSPARLGIIASLACLAGTPAAAADTSLVCIKASGPITLDGTADAAWDKAPALKVALDKTPYKPDIYPGITSTSITLKSVQDGESIYFLLQYQDPTKSLARYPWIKQEDGSWKQMKKRDSTDHDNTYYEDKFAVLWDINTKGFAKKGCAITCHMAEGGKINGVADKSPGRKFTNAPGETVDMWHWKGVRTGPNGQVDDQYINDNNPADAKDWGRRGDVKTGGGYADNVNKDKTAPAFMSAKPDAANPYWIRDEDKVPFVDTFKPGDIVAGMVIKPFTGPRGDLSCASKWADGTWTIEIKRKLVTTGDKAAEHDVQFNDLTKAYPFGVAVFDNSQINHMYHDGVLKLTFKQ